MQVFVDKASMGGENALYGLLTNLALSNDYTQDFMSDLIWDLAKPDFVEYSTFDELCDMATSYAEDAIIDYISTYQ